MSNFLKNFALGIVYIIILPFIVLGTVLAGLYGLMSNILLSLKGIVRFFKGERFLARPQEDEEIALIIKRQQDLLKNPEPAPATQQASPSPSNVYVQNNYYQGTKPADPASALGAPTAPIEGTGNFVNNPSLSSPQPVNLNSPSNPEIKSPINPTYLGQGNAEPVKEIVANPVNNNEEAKK
jgi:hypothetical protein